MTDSPTTIECPFAVLIDSREQLPYSFDNLYAGPVGRSRRIIVPTRRVALAVGDYSVFGWPRIVIERKSKEDLWNSISQARENFVGRLEKMGDSFLCDWAAVMVEAEWGEILSQPPPFTEYRPKSLARTIQAWMIRFPAVHWIFMPGRDFAEAMTFRLLERYWKDRQTDKTAETAGIAAETAGIAEGS
jgi:ERCC4-type nuclease